jgi:polyhydroxyalkanoate synthase
MSESESRALTGDVAEVTRELTRISQLSGALLLRQVGQLQVPELDSLNLRRPLFKATLNTVRHPQRILQAQWDFTRRYFALLKYLGFRAVGKDVDPAAEVPKGDRRFRSEAWNEHLIFDLLRQVYLTTADWMLANAARMEELEPDDRARIRFYTRQFADALSPSNYVLTNPEILETTRKQRGLNLLRGFRMLLEDLQQGDGQLLISMTDKSKFEVGRNIATTEGAVVFENDMMQLIQYSPRTKTAFEKPLLIVPPWINKYYILDLQPKNSFIRWAVDRGHTVFVISWVNPDESYRDKGFDDYMKEGILEALVAIERATGMYRVNAIGYCIGGTLLAATLAWMKAMGEDRIASATFFTAQVDFTEAGDLRVFIDDKQLKQLEKRMAERGYLDGKAMAMTFNMLRANDLIWTFVINNYLLGRKPPEFDLLYWNSDATRLPERTHTWYLRKLYHENRLVEPGGVELAGVPIDLTTVDLPVYIQATRDDHIAPFRSVYKATQIYSGDVTFMLAGSGHIAGVINPPAAKKYGYWTHDELPPDPDEWLEDADYHTGSWWPHWNEWIKQYAGPRVPARVPGDGELDVIEPAPGRYVRG